MDLLSYVEYGAKTDYCKHNRNSSASLKHSLIRDCLHEKPVHVVKGCLL